MSDLGNKEVFAANLKSRLYSRGITATKLADDLNIPLTTISNWLRAKAYPRIDKIEMLARYFNCQKSDLVEVQPQESRSYLKYAPNIEFEEGPPLSFFIETYDPHQEEAYARIVLEANEANLNKRTIERLIKYFELLVKAKDINGGET